jgi:hypothetical protein
MNFFSQLGRAMTTDGKFFSQFQESKRPSFPHNYLNTIQIMKIMQLCTLFAVAILKI